MNQQDQPLKMAEWCETDPKIVITHKHGKHVSAHVTYGGFATQAEVDKILAPAGVIDKVGDLFVSVVPPSFPWTMLVEVEWEHQPYSSQIYGTHTLPLEPGVAFNFTITLPD